MVPPSHPFCPQIGSYIFPHEHETRLKRSCFDIIDKSQTKSHSYECQSHIGHSYDSNNADKRISISFNVMPKTLPGLYNFKIMKI